MASADEAGGAGRRRVQDFLLTVALIGGLFAIPRIPVRDLERPRRTAEPVTAGTTAACPDRKSDHGPCDHGGASPSVPDERHLAARPTPDR